MATWQEIQNSEKFKSLSPEEKRTVADNWLERTLSSQTTKGWEDDKIEKLKRGVYSTLDSDALSYVKSGTEKGIKGETEPEGTVTPGLSRFLKTFELPTYLSLGVMGGPAGLLAAAAAGTFLTPLQKNLYDKLIEQEKAQYKGMNTDQAQKFDQKRSGIASDLMDAASNSTVGRMLYSFHPEESQQKIEGITPQGYQYKPNTSLLHSVASVLTDSPLYVAGTALGGPMGTFSLPATLRKLYEAKISKKLPNKLMLNEEERGRLLDVMKDIGKEFVASSLEGLAVHGAGKLAGKVVDRIGLFRAFKKAGGAEGTGMSKDLFYSTFEGTPSKIGTFAARVPAVAGAMTGVDQAAQAVGLRDKAPYSLEDAGNTLGTIAVLELMGLPNQRYRRPTKDYRSHAEAMNDAAKDLKLTQRELWEMAKTPEGVSEINRLYAERNREKQAPVEKQNEQIVPQKEFEMPEELLEKDPGDLQPVMETVYPDAWDRKTKSIKPEAYSKKPKVQENIGNAVNQIWDIIKQTDEREPGTMQRLVKNPDEYKEFFDTHLFDEGARSAWENKAYRRSIESKVKKLINQYSDAESWQQARQWQEQEKPYQKLIRVAQENTPPETPPTLLDEQGREIKLSSTKLASEVAAKKAAAEQKMEAAKIERANKEQAAIRKEQESKVNQQVELYDRSAIHPEYESKQLSKRVAKSYDIMKDKMVDSTNVVRELMAIKPEQYQGVLSELKGADRYFYNPYHRSVGQFLINPSREIERVGGPKLAKMFITPWRAAGMKFVLEDKYAKNENKTFQSKNQFTAEERENAGLFMIAQQEGGLDAIVAMGKKVPELSDREKKIVSHVQERLVNLIPRINAARESVGLKPIGDVKNYFTFLRKFTIAEELGWNPLFSDNFLAMKENVSPKGFAFQFGKERVESSRALETDAMYVLDRYTNAAVRTINYTPVVGKLREIIETPSFKDENPKFHSILTGALDHMAGMRRQNEGEISYRMLDKAANTVNKGLGAFYLAWNMGTVAIQPLAYIMTYGEFGPKYATKGLMKFVGDAKAREYAQKSSNVLASRVADITIEEMRKGVHGAAGKAYAKVADWGTLPMRYVDYGTAMATWLAAHECAKGMGLTGKDAINFADEKVIRTQGSADRIDISPVQRTPIGKALTIFNTFTINQWNWLIKDVVGNENKSMSQKSMQLGRFIAASMMANTIYEMMGYFAPPVISNTPFPAPLSTFYKTLNGQGFFQQQFGPGPMGSEKEQPQGNAVEAAYQAFLESMGIVPVVGGSFRYGGKSMGGAVGSAAYEALETMSGARGAKPIPYHIAKFAGVPGGQQAWKIYKAYNKSKGDDGDDISSIKRQMRKDSGIRDFKLELRRIKQQIRN